MKQTDIEASESKPEREYAPRWQFVDRATHARLNDLGLTSPQDASLRLLSAYIANHAPDPESTLVSVPHDVVDQCRGTSRPASGVWLSETFCPRVGTHMSNDGEWVRPTPSRPGRHRRVCSGFLGEIPAPRADAITTYVHVVSGRAMKEYQTHPAELPTAYEAQSRVLRYHVMLPERLYSLTQVFLERALDAVAGDRVHISHLRTITLAPKAVPAPSKKKNTFRVFVPGYTDLKKAARHELMPWLVELDLNAAYIAILARVAQLNDVATPVLDALLAQGGDIWNAAAESMGAAGFRSEVKLMVTAAAFGGTQQDLEEALQGNHESLDEAVQKAPHVLTSRLVREVRSLYKVLAAKAKQDGIRGYQRSVRGKEALTNPKQRWVGQLLHLICSEYEMVLLDAAYSVAERWGRRGGFILLPQHDGCAVQAPEHLLPSFISDLQTAVTVRAERLGVLTRMVVKTRNASPVTVAAAA